MTTETKTRLHVVTILDLSDLPQQCITDCGAGGGAKDEPVAAWREKLGFTVDRANAIRCLEGYGAWDREELAEMSDSDLADKILWLACGTFAEYQTDPDAGSDLFVLE